VAFAFRQDAGPGCQNVASFFRFLRTGRLARNLPMKNAADSAVSSSCLSNFVRAMVVPLRCACRAPHTRKQTPAFYERRACGQSSPRCEP
jgi:hypothetical protein